MGTHSIAYYIIICQLCTIIVALYYHYNVKLGQIQMKEFFLN